MRRIKNGRYVNTSKGVGIIFDQSNYPSIEVHIIDKKGETVKAIFLQPSEIQVLDRPLLARRAQRELRPNRASILTLPGGE